MTNEISHVSETEIPADKPKNGLSRASYTYNSCQMESESGRGGGRAHVFHKPREAVQKLLISNPGKYCLERTMSRFPRDEHYMQCYGS